MIIAISGKIGSGKDTIGIIIQKLCLGHNIDEIAYSIVHNSGTKEQRKDSGWEIKKFAGKLKQIVSILTGIPVGDLEKQEVKDSRLPEIWHSFDDTSHYVEPDTVRELLQKVGTEAMRNVIHENVWVNALFVDYNVHIEDYPQLIKSNGKNLIAGNVYSMGKAVNSKWIITDLRFPNELQAVKDKGGISIRINRDLIIGEDGYGYTTVSVNQAEKDGIIKPQHESETALDNATFDYVIENNGTIEDLIKKVKSILINEKII